MHGWQTCYREFCRGVRLGLRCFSSSPLQNPSKGWQVSSYGRCCNSHGIISGGNLHPNGYRYVTICGQSWAVHRVVMLAFNGPPHNEQAWQVHHEDGDRANNRLDNLDYVTPSQNVLHSYARSSRRSNGPAISKPVMWRRRGTEKWTLSPSGRQAAEQLGLTRATVSAVCRGKASNREFEIQFQEASPSILNGEEWRPMLDPASGDQLCKRMVSSFGRVTSKTGLIGKGSLGRSGYYFTSVTCTPVPTRVVAVHRLVAFAFLGPPPCVHLTQVNHKDLDKGNNSADNLEWVSPAENLSHFHANNMFKRRNGKTVLTRVHGSTGVWKWHCSIQSAARATGTNRWNIWKCCNGRSLQTRGHEFKHADIDEAKSLPGEEWREVDIKVLRDDRIARRGQVWYMRSIALKWRSDGSQVSSSFDTQKESQIVDGWQKSRWC